MFCFICKKIQISYFLAVLAISCERITTSAINVRVMLLNVSSNAKTNQSYICAQIHYFFTVYIQNLSLSGNTYLKNDKK